MKLTDKEAIKLRKKANCCDLDDNISTMPQDEFEESGRSELQFVQDEIEYLVDMYEEDGTIYSEDLEQAQEILRATKNGKQMPLYADSLLPRYRPWEVENAKSTVSEYRRLKRLQKTF